MFSKTLAKINPFCLVVEDENIVVTIDRRKKQIYTAELDVNKAYSIHKSILRVVYPGLAKKIENKFKISLSDYGVFCKTIC